MSFKGTEGKWTVIDGKASGKQVISDSAPKNRMNVASCGGQRREENAKLIAAAPELLEALRLLRDYVEDVLAVSTDDCDPQHPLIRATSVISKALGQ